MSDQKIFNFRKFTSIGLFFTLFVLFITAVVIQIFEATKNELCETIFTVIHIFSGLTFTILSILHLRLNWKMMKSHLRRKTRSTSREFVSALILTIITIFVGITFVLFIMD